MSAYSLETAIAIDNAMKRVRKPSKRKTIIVNGSKPKPVQYSTILISGMAIPGTHPMIAGMIGSNAINII